MEMKIVRFTLYYSCLSVFDVSNAEKHFYGYTINITLWLKG